MTDDTASTNLQYVLEQRGEKVHKPRSTVLLLTNTRGYTQ